MMENNKYNLFPQRLKDQKQWVLWKYEKNKKTQKITKVPYKNTAQHASSTDPTTWNNFANIQTYFEKYRDEFGGIGYVLNEGVVGIDLDHCFNEDKTRRRTD